jgi:hypothetical protein
MSLAVTGWIRTEAAHTQNADDKKTFKDNAQ